MTEHHKDCDWHVDQYPWECTCGFIPRKKAMDDLIAQDADLIDIEPVAYRYGFDGYGWQYIDNGSGSDWAIRHPDAEPLYAHSPADRLEALEAEVERLRKLTCATWFYMPDEGDRCWFSPHEVIDEMYDPEPGNHVFEVECATSLPSIWCAVRVTDDPDADERFTFTEHATEAEARAALGEKQ